MKKYERLTLKNIQLRSQEVEGKKTLVGILPYDSPSEDMGGFREIISRTAFNKTLADGAEVRALYNHDTSRILGSTRSGTLRLNNTDEGLVAEVDLPNTSYANDLYEIVSRSDVSTMSFGFTPVKVENSRNLRTLKEVALAEVSFGVTFPAYPETNSVAMLRSMEMLESRGLDLESLAAILAKDNLDTEDISKLSQFRDDINALIPAKEEPKPAAEPQPSDDTADKEALAQLELEMEIEQSL